MRAEVSMTELEQAASGMARPNVPVTRTRFEAVMTRPFVEIPPGDLESAERSSRLHTDGRQRYKRIENRGMAMSDLLGSARELRQKLYRLEVLLDVEKGRRKSSRGAKSPAKDAERGAALKRLVASGLIEADSA